MCTASWLEQDKSFNLFFNRDEARTRGLALPPEVSLSAGVTFLAPRDADFGGTWLAANEFGLVLCLLNNYQSVAGLLKDYFSKFTSRGEIIPHLIGASDLADFRARAELLAFHEYRPFVLAAFHQTGSLTISWDGKHRQYGENPQVPLISSAFNYAEAKKNRARLFRATDLMTPDKMLALHRSHLPEKGELSICMHRAEAHTVSLTHVSVDEDEVVMEYFAGSPCEATDSVRQTIPRRT